MQTIEYKKYRIDYVYDCSEGYDEINYYNVWTPDGLDLVDDQFVRAWGQLIQAIYEQKGEALLEYGLQETGKLCFKQGGYLLV